MVDKILRSLLALCILALIATNPWFNFIDLISIPGWRNLSESEKLEKCVSWEEEVSEDLGVLDAPTIVTKSVTDDDVYSNCCGLYQHWDNTIVLYLDNIDDVVDAYDTVCHEMRHAYQRQESLSGSDLGDQYAVNFKNYIKCYEDEKGYRQQLVEADAYDYAASMVKQNFFDLFFN